ncbi:MAG: hypothetical protein KAX05_09000 [Bacteroidales bacterium]|nr:hypothetical protein [Bacteroidales bacterium]
MKKWIFKPIFLLVAGVLIVFACEREEFTVEEAIDAQNEVIELLDSLEYLRDSLRRMAGVIHYTVNVVNMSDATEGAKSVAGVAGAIVTTSQHGVIVSETTPDNGMVVFDDLRVGNIAVTVEAPGYTSVDYEAQIQAENDTNVNNYYDVMRNMATMVPVYSTTENLATIEGIVSLDSDLTNKVKENLSGVLVFVNIKPENLKIECEGCYGYGYDYGLLYGTITSSLYHGTQTTSTTDANGAYSIKVPATPAGLDVEIEVSEYAINQSILLNEYNSERVTGVQNVRTYFSSNYSPSSIPDVPGAYAEFSDPAGTVAEAPDEMAHAEAHVGESGLMSVDINTVGTGYTQAPMLVVSLPDNPMGTQAEVVANLVDGRVTSIDVVESGSGYTSTPSITIYHNVGDGIYGDQAFADVTVAYSVIEFVMDNQGDGYTSRPNVIVNSPAGSGASGQAVLSGYVSDVVLTDGGSGYICPPQALASSPETGTDVASFTVDMSDYHPLHSILVNDNFDGGPYETTPEVEITGFGGYGSGATAVAQLNNSGRVENISINNPGAGYTTAPTVNIVGGGGFGAEAYTTISGGSISSIVVVEKGQNYTSLPTIEISAPPAGGTQATAEAVLAYYLESIILTNPGSGYDVYYSDPDNYENEPTVTIDGTDYSEGTTKITVRPNMSVEGISVTNDGSGYESIPTITFNSNCGEGSGAAATAELRYSISDIQIITEGSGYLNQNDVTVSIDVPENGTPATAYEVLGNGKVQKLDLTDGGQGYTASPYVAINGSTPDEDADITANLSNGEITGFTINDGGQGYPYGTYSVSIYTHMPGGANLNLSGRVYENAGIIERIEVTNPGAGYTVAPRVEFDNEGTGGTGAAAIATIENGRVAGIEITNPGAGYLYAPDIRLVGENYIEKAVALCQVNDLGRITGVLFNCGGINYLTRGRGYTEEPTVTFYPQISGVGQGAEAEIVVINGQIVDVIMLNQGSGYTSSNYPTSGHGYELMPVDNNNIVVIPNKNYIKDIYLGTGKREITD